MHNPEVSFILQPPLNPTHLPNTQVQQPAGLNLRPLAFQHRCHRLQPITFLLTHLYPVSAHPLSYLGKRTFLTS